MSHRDYAVSMISAPPPDKNYPPRMKKSQDGPAIPKENQENIKIHSLTDPKTNNIDSRSTLVADSIIGFLGFFATIAFIEAVINVFQPEPAVLPAVVALAFISATAVAVRWRRRL